jgi:hypothetical protein
LFDLVELNGRPNRICGATPDLPLVKNRRTLGAKVCFRWQFS